MFGFLYAAFRSDGAKTVDAVSIPDILIGLWELILSQYESFQP